MTETLSRRDKIIPWYFVMFFVVIALVDGVMVTLAVRTQTGTITDHPYEKGLTYNKVVNAESTQEKLGWNAAIALDGTTLTVTLKDAQGKMLHPETIRAEFVRPTQSGMDFEATLKDGPNAIDFPAEGLWEIRVFCQVGTTTYQQAQRVVVQ